jgi:hypothetical protein
MHTSYPQGEPQSYGFHQYSCAVNQTRASSRVDRPKVSLHPPDFLLQHLVPKPRLKLALPQTRRRHVHRLLAAPNEHVRRTRRDRRTIQRRLRRERLQHPQRLRLVHPCALVFGARDEVRSIRRELQVRDDIAMCTLVALDLLARGDVEEGDLAGLVARDDDGAPSSVGGEGTDGGLASDREDLVKGLLVLCMLYIIASATSSASPTSG